jgi:hypothetical protein
MHMLELVTLANYKHPDRDSGLCMLLKIMGLGIYYVQDVNGFVFTYGTSLFYGGASKRECS